MTLHLNSFNSIAHNNILNLLKSDWLIVWCLTPFSTVFQLYHGGQCTYPCFVGVLLTSALTVFFPSHWLLSHLTIVETTYSDERGMNPVATTIIVPQRSNQRPPVFKSATLPTELWGLDRKSEAFEDDSLSQRVENFFERVKNIVGKGENADYQPFLLSQQYSLKPLYQASLQ